MDIRMKDLHILDKNDKEIFTQRAVTEIKIKNNCIEVDNDCPLDLSSHKFIVLPDLKGIKIVID